MRVGVDASCWSNPRGYGRHARALLTALVNVDQVNSYTFFVDGQPSSGGTDLPARVDVNWVTSSVPTVRAATASSRRSLRDMWRMSKAISRANLDVVFFPTIYSYVPLWGKARRVVMIHDVIAEKFPDLTLPNRGARFAWNTKVRLGRWQADAIATVSDYSRRQIVDHFGIPPRKVFVVDEASDPIFRVLEQPALTPKLLQSGVPTGGRSVVYIGGFGPHKNVSTLIGAFASLGDHAMFSDVRLILVGDNTTEAFHTEIGALRQQVRELAIEDRVVFTGYLPDEDLVALLNMATVLVLPSLMEGFGLPAVEAAACGCPVIATTASPLPDLLGDAAVYVDPLESAQLEAALARVLDSPEVRLAMREAGLLAARRLTWSAAARQMRDLLEHVNAA